MRVWFACLGVAFAAGLSGCGEDTTLVAGAPADTKASGVDAQVGDPDAVTIADIASDSTATDVSIADIAADATASDAAVGADAQPADVAPQCLTANNCDDTNPCTTDTCDAGGCNHAAIAGCVPPLAACDASHPCAKGKCDPVAHTCVACLVAADCGAGFLCQDKVCTTAPGCKSDLECKASKQVCSVAEGVCVDCNVTTDCAVNQACSSHVCVAAPPCKSSKDCIGICDTISGTCVDCISDADCKAYQFCQLTNHTCAADLCQGPGCSGNTAFACLPNGSGFGASINCDDGIACTVDGCTLGTGCVHGNSSAPCSDGNACTTADTCSGGLCVGLQIDCNDSNVCTADACNVATGCTHTNVAGACDDGQDCTSSDACTAGKCAGAAVSCDDGLQCTSDTCIAGSGCAHAPLTGTECTDGNGCTANDACNAGSCVGGAAPSCDDANGCTTDSCVAPTGCLHTNVAGGPCDDGSQCTLQDACVAGKCVGTALVCDDQNPCTDNTCGATQGCLFPQNSLPCSDNNACTTADACGGGSCKGGVALVCNDNNICTVDSCDPTKGCVFTPTSGLPCDDKNFCTVGDTCAVGVCSGTVNTCDDANVCTADSCANNACVHTNVVDGSSCGTFDGCTGDFCSAGTCLKATERLWEKTVDAPSSADSFLGVARTADGGFALAGETAVANAGQDGWLVKLGGGGAQQWAKTYGGGGDDRLRGIVGNADGTLTAVGVHAGNGGHAWLLMVDSAGTVQLDSTFGAAGGDQFRAVAAAPAGGWIAVGARAIAQGAGGTLDDGWLVRLGTSGAQTWEKTFGTGQAGDNLYAVVALADGSFVAAGTRTQNNGAILGWLLKVDANGNQLWSRTFTQNGGVEFRGLAQSGSGLAVVGWTTANGGIDGLLQLTDTSGNGVDQRRFNKSNQDYLFGISAIGSGGYLLAGQQSGNNGTAWYLRTDALGNETWSKTWGGAGNDAAYAVQGLADATAIVAGTSSPGTNATDGLARHIDLFGNTSCAASGTCITKLPNACDDGNPCTLDQCGAGTCSHSNLPNGTVCGANGNQCDAGNCVAG